MTSSKARTTPGHSDPEVVRKAEAVFAEMGMAPEEAIALFYKQTALRGSFPITDLIPNGETQEVVRKARAGSEIVSYSSVDGMMAELDDAGPNPHDKI